MPGEIALDASSWFTLYGAIKSNSNDHMVHISRAQITKDLILESYDSVNIQFATIDSGILEFLDFDLFNDNYGRSNIRATLGTTTNKSKRYITRNLIVKKSATGGF